MISNLKETKYYFENLFATKWTETPVHFVGQEYNSKGVSSWINPRFAPSGGRLSALSGQQTKLRGELDVVCWAKNDVDAFDLADKTIAFVSNNATDFSLTNFEISDHGWNESNMVYVVITFIFTYYAGTCVVSKKSRYIKHNGKTVTNNGTILIK
jgi:hypothetical protein